MLEYLLDYFLGGRRKDEGARGPLIACQCLTHQQSEGGLVTYYEVHKLVYIIVYIWLLKGCQDVFGLFRCIYYRKLDLKILKQKSLGCLIVFGSSLLLLECLGERLHIKDFVFMTIVYVISHLPFHIMAKINMGWPVGGTTKQKETRNDLNSMKLPNGRPPLMMQYAPNPVREPQGTSQLLFEDAQTDERIVMEHAPAPVRPRARVRQNECHQSRAQQLRADGDADLDLQMQNSKTTIISMACSYFDGYLLEMIPTDGADVVGFVENVNIFEATHRIPFPVKKLFIVLPKSMYCPPDLKDCNRGQNRPTLEAIGSLQDKLKDVAGVKNRLYRNSVYKIARPGRRAVHVCAEFASPLMRLYGMLQRPHLFQEIAGVNQSQVVPVFAEQLRRLIDRSAECRGYCELVFYDDQNENLADILLDKIAEIEPNYDEIIRTRLEEFGVNLPS